MSVNQIQFQALDQISHVPPGDVISSEVRDPNHDSMVEVAVKDLAAVLSIWQRVVLVPGVNFLVNYHVRGKEECVHCFQIDKEAEDAV